MKTAEHKYRTLAAHFRREMESGALKPGDRLPSLSEMRASFGASRPTVDKVHSVLAEEGLCERLHGIGTIVTRPRRGATGIIGLSGPGFATQGTSPYWAQVMQGILSGADHAGVPIVMLGHESSAGWEKADGLIISDWNSVGAMRHVPASLPRVSVLANHDGIACVSPDDFQGARDAVRHLLELGHRRIGFLHSYLDHSVTQNRLAGYEHELRAAGITPRAEWKRVLHGIYDYGVTFTAEARKNMLLWLSDDWAQSGCTALLCHNDETAFGVIAALQEKGFMVPRDVSVVGFDGTEICDLATPRLTSVAAPLYEIGSAAFELLQAQISQGKAGGDTRVLASKLAVRDSTAPPRK